MKITQSLLLSLVAATIFLDAIDLSMALECHKCSNDLESDERLTHCSSDVEQGAGEIETCADDVTSCYLAGYTGFDRVTMKVRSLSVIRGCLSTDVKLSFGKMVNDDVMVYASSCTDDKCNVSHAMQFPNECVDDSDFGIGLPDGHRYPVPSEMNKICSQTS